MSLWPRVCFRYAAHCEVFVELLRHRRTVVDATSRMAESLGGTHRRGVVASTAGGTIDADLLHLRLNAFHSVQALSKFSHFPG